MIKTYAEFDSLTYRLAAAIICITCLVYSTMIRRRSRIRNRLFLMLVVLVLFDCCTGIFSYFVVHTKVSVGVKAFTTYTCELLYYTTHIAIVPVLFFYIVTICGIKHKFSPLQHLIIRIPFYMMEIMILTTPFTNFIFERRGDYGIVRGKGSYVAYFMAGCYFIFGVSILVRYWFTINKLKRIAMVYFFTLAVVGILVQMLIPRIICELLCEAIGLMGFMIMIEKDDDISDVNSGAYNRAALVQDVRSLFRIEREFETICIRLDDVDILRKILGYEMLGELLGQIVSFLDSLDETGKVYHTGFSYFYAIYAERTRTEVEQLVHKISDRFEKDWIINGRANRIGVKILLADSPSQFKNLDDVLLLATTNLDGINKKVLCGHDLDFLLRRIEVEKAIGRGISEKNFGFFYRPVYRAGDNRIKLAEVTIRLVDNELGEIQPDEFFEVADGSGFIGEIQQRVIEEVCRFLASGVDKSDMQIDYVLIPVMSYRLINADLVRSVKTCIDRYNFDPSLMVFEVNEANAILAQDHLEKLIEGFDELGIKLFINNYENAFLKINTDSIYKFMGVIINVRKLFDTEEEANAEIVFENRVNMIRQLGKKLIFTGIDTAEYYDKIKDEPADYILGDFLSVGISKNELQNKFWHGEKLVITDGNVERIEEDD